MKPREAARRYLAKAAQDEALLDRIVADETIADEIFGFHCQQAGEKLIKAAILALGGRLRRTHDLGHLVGVAADLGASIPPEIEAARTLTPFAVEYRYGFLDDEAVPLDRPAARAVVAAVRRWAETILAGRSSG